MLTSLKSISQFQKLMNFMMTNLEKDSLNTSLIRPALIKKSSIKTPSFRWVLDVLVLNLMEKLEVGSREPINASLLLQSMLKQRQSLKESQDSWDLISTSTMKMMRNTCAHENASTQDLRIRFGQINLISLAIQAMISSVQEAPYLLTLGAQKGKDLMRI